MAVADKGKLIGTHNGTFHTDEVFACYMLKKLPKFKDHVILRTRDLDLLKNCEIVVDVGSVYSHANKRYDHHQREFDNTMRTVCGLEFDTKLSSAGLIYAHYGKYVIDAVLNSTLSLNANDLNDHTVTNSDDHASPSAILDTNEDKDTSIIELPSSTLPSASTKNSTVLSTSRHKRCELIDMLYVKLYQCFVEGVDAIDNGIQQYDGIPRYQLPSSLHSRVAHCNPKWNDKDADVDACFNKAMSIVKEEFEDRVNFLYNSWLPAKNIVKDAILQREKVHQSGKVLEFEGGGVPWKEHFFELEQKLELQSADISFAIYPDNINGVFSQWRIQAIPVSENSGFKNRIALIEKWRGLRGSALEEVAGITGINFVHASGFTGGANTREGVLAMAVETLREAGKLD